MLPTLLRSKACALSFAGFGKIFSDKIIVDFAEIAQLVERRTENPGVPSSTLGLGILLRQNAFAFGPPSPRLRRDSSEALAKENFEGIILFQCILVKKNVSAKPKAKALGRSRTP